ALKMTDRPSGADAANVYGFMEPAWGGGIMASWVRDFGGEVLDESGAKAQFATKEMQATWQYALDLHFKHKGHPMPDQQKALGDYHAMFVQQKVAMFRHPPWGVLATTDIPEKGDAAHFEWSAIAFPKGPSGKRGSQLGGTVIGMNPQTKATDEALK